MAKQQGLGVVAAARRVSDTQGRFQDVGGQFMTGYNKSLEAKKAREAKAKEGIARANALMDGFKDDIDYMSFTPEEGKLVKDQVVAWRNGYANLASQAAKIEDKTSSEYQSLMDEMSGYKNRLVSLKNNIDGRQQLKADFKTELNDYSTAGFNDEAIAKATVMAAMPFSGVNDRGELMWSDEGLGEFSSTGFKMPASNKPAKQAALNIFNEVERQSKARGPLTEGLKDGLRTRLDNSIGSNENLLSFIADNQFETFKFDDLDPESDISELRKTVLDRLMNGLESTRGSALAKPAGSRGNNNDTRTSAQKDYDSAVRRIQNGFTARVPIVIQKQNTRVSPSGKDSWIVEEWDPAEKIWVESAQRERKTLDGLIGLLPVS
jgi:hypothetical protein